MYKSYEVHLQKCRERYERNKKNPEWREKFTTRSRLATRKYRENNLEECRKREREKQKEYRSEYYKTIPPEKRKARQVLFYSISIGLIKKPKKCSKCDKSNGRIEGHHKDYLKPLEVEWLCSICHGKKERKD